MNGKNKLGQFYTTNYAYILQNIHITTPATSTTIIEPFCGNGDLLPYIEIETKTKGHNDNNNSLLQLECYDIDPKHDYITRRDTLRNPPTYKDKYVITNPPYLARNKCDEKELFDIYGVNDLYKCFITNLIRDPPTGGILIVPLNFWSSIRKIDVELRKQFLQQFRILQLNIFEEKVFEDTTYTICSFQFELLLSPQQQQQQHQINIDVYPSQTNIKVALNDENHYTIGGCIYNLSQSTITTRKYKITRMTTKNKTQHTTNGTNLLVKCIDDNENNRISLTMADNYYIDETPNLSARTYASLLIEPPINTQRQQQLANAFNLFINEERRKYCSLFLTNYRESKDIARKRISFDLVYNIVGYLLEKEDKEADGKGK